MRGGDGVIERKYIVEQEFIDELNLILDRLIDEESGITKLYGNRLLIKKVHSMRYKLREVKE